MFSYICEEKSYISTSNPTLLLLTEGKPRSSDPAECQALYIVDICHCYHHCMACNLPKTYGKACSMLGLRCSASHYNVSHIQSGGRN